MKRTSKNLTRSGLIPLPANGGRVIWSPRKSNPESKSPRAYRAIPLDVVAGKWKAQS